MRRKLALWIVLCLCMSMCMAETIIISVSQETLELNEYLRLEGDRVLAVDSVEFLPSQNSGKQILSVRCYFKNLSHENMAFADECSMNILFREKFEMPLEFEKYTHVRANVDAGDSFIAEPLVEIYGVWSVEVPDAIAAAGEGELVLNWDVAGTTYSVQLR